MRLDLLVGLAMLLNICNSFPAISKQVVYTVHSEVKQDQNMKPIKQLLEKVSPTDTFSIQKTAGSAPSTTPKIENFDYTIGFTPTGLSVESQGQRIIYDFDKRRVYTIDLTANTYMDFSLYAILSFRLSEMQNRLMLAKILEKSGAKDAMNLFDPVYLAADFGLDLAPELTKGKIEKTESEKQTTYMYRNLLLTKFEASNNELSPSDMVGFSRFLHYNCRLFPSIRIDLVKSGKLPQQFTTFTLEQGNGEITDNFALKSVKDDPLDLSVPKEAKLVFNKDDQLAPIIARINELGGKPPVDLQQRLIAELESHLKDKQFLDAFLCSIEYSLSTGKTDPEMSQKLNALQAETNADPLVQKLILGVTPPQDAATAQKSLDALDSINRTNLKKGYLLDVFRANLLETLDAHGTKISTTGEPSPIKSFIKVLMTNPFLVGPYADLGQIFYRQYEMTNAWECWDIAMRLAPDHPMLEDVQQIKHMCDTTMPDFIDGDRPQ